MAPNAVMAFVLLVIAFGLFVDGHTLYRRDVDELFDPKHDHDVDGMITAPSSEQENVSNRPLLKEDTVGYSLIQHNNPYLPGEKRSRQALPISPNGVCNPDQVNCFIYLFLFLPHKLCALNSFMWLCTTYKCLINLIPKGKLHLVETWQTFLTSLIFQICSDEKYRSFDGSCNNLKNPSWGMKNLKFLKFSTDCILHIPGKFFWGNCFSIILDKT